MQYFQLGFRDWVGKTEKNLEICSDCGWSPDFSYVYWTVHHCDNWRIKNQLDATYYFIYFL